MLSSMDATQWSRIGLVITGILIACLLVASGVQILEHQKTIEKLKQQLTAKEQDLAVATLNLQNAEDANLGLNRVILLQQDVHKEAEKQRQSLNTAMQQLQQDLKQAYGKLPKPVPASPNISEPKEDLHRSAQRILVIWDAYCKTMAEHPGCAKEKVQ